MSALQLGLFARGAAQVDVAFRRLRREPLSHGAWIEWAPGWLSGHLEVFEALRGTTGWRSERVPMYERMVAVPRLTATLPEDGPGHPVLDAARVALEARYGLRLPHLSLGYYRDGRDSVAPHGDRVMRDHPGDTLMATVSVGARRRFLLRPRRAGRALTLQLGEGDLVVMGGSVQRTYLHGVPKTACAGPRIVCMFRA